jgi:hypothetical protein
MAAHLQYVVPLVALIVSAPALLMRASVAAESACAEAAAPEIAPPAGNGLAFALEAEGVQIYSCAAGAGAGPSWRFDAPEAMLLDGHAQPAGTHGAGPFWQAADGSRVVAAKMSAVTPDARAIPWLLLRAGEHRGDGRMSEVTFVQRIATTGGLAPPEGCSASSVGTVVRVPYRALYCFYRGERR